ASPVPGHAAEDAPDGAGQPGLDRFLVELRGLVPVPAQPVVKEGIARLVDYQDEAYAWLYLDRLRPVITLDERHGDGTYRLSTEVARYLALGMAYEDTIRVAELKIRGERFARVAREVKLADGQVLKIAEFLHPRLQEIAESVPARLGRFLEGNAIA